MLKSTVVFFIAMTCHASFALKCQTVSIESTEKNTIMIDVACKEIPGTQSANGCPLALRAVENGKVYPLVQFNSEACGYGTDAQNVGFIFVK